MKLEKKKYKYSTTAKVENVLGHVAYLAGVFELLGGTNPRANKNLIIRLQLLRSAALNRFIRT